MEEGGDSEDSHDHGHHHDDSYDSSLDVVQDQYFSKVFAIEFVINCIFPWPYFYQVFFMTQLAPADVDFVVYFITDIFLILMFFRVYFVIRHIERYHSFTDVYSKKIFKAVYGIEQDRLFTCKYEISRHPTRATLWIFTVSVMILAAILRILERPYELNDSIKSDNY